eukprot:CAMPEP_0180527222 /NCGR_PEP_ID=MMETSP1036_2-20121128/60121_1 /TAXON_ID=632150 /ORGANISM="Azadinium spinosum, Strain 3D9" /LENGTH=115 /DNA_ID=CAMNT_0022540643 /DNA_START=300 /DNA_END=644 /DNA_ORIENTATION=+
MYEEGGVRNGEGLAGEALGLLAMGGGLSPSIWAPRGSACEPIRNNKVDEGSEPGQSPSRVAMLGIRLQHSLEQWHMDLHRPHSIIDELLPEAADWVDQGKQQRERSGTRRIQHGS